MNSQFFPDQVARKFEEIDFDQALSDGRKYLCLDLDNTLLPQKGHVLPEIIGQHLRGLVADRRVKDLCLISNVILPGHRLARLQRMASELCIHHVIPGFFWNRKPKGAPFLKALALMGARPEECVMVGDQIFSDILGGNRLGFYTIWVKPIADDHWSTLLTGRRRREKKVLQELHRQGKIDSSFLS